MTVVRAVDTVARGCSFLGRDTVLLDLRALEAGQRLACDICIVGSGAAGITIAHRLKDTRLQIVVLEAGGEELEPEIQDAYVGRNIGLPYFDLDVCRLRYFGGTTNHWAGFCMPFRSYEFDRYPWIPYSGWPFGYREIRPWIEETKAFLGFASDDWNVSKLARELERRPWKLDPKRFENAVHVIRPVRFGQVFRSELERSDHVRVVLHADVTRIHTTPAGDRVLAIEASNRAGKDLTVSARAFVLAAGGIENARLMLLPTPDNPRGIGNDYGMVGRFFGEHPVFRAAEILPVDPGVDAWFYENQRTPTGRRVAPFLVLRPEAWERERIGPVTFDLRPLPDEAYEAPGVWALRRLRGRLARREFDGLGDDLLDFVSGLDDVATFGWKFLRHGQTPIRRIDCYVAMVPVPNPESRVMLGDERDHLGRPRVVLDWRLTPFDQRSVQKAVELLGAEVARLGIGRLRSLVHGDDWNWPDDLEGANHHVGTTRMSEDPRTGVVDRDARVHGIDNLYVAGSSIFPFPGIGTPTFMIVALAMRLADHLRGRLAK